MKIRSLITIGSLILLITGLLLAPENCLAQTPGQGMLTIVEPDGKTGEGCPLEHTSVKVEIAGFVARVSVTQVFHNPRKDKIEAIYTFPLSSEGAVDDMIMRVGDRVVRGVIKRREEARRIYEQARDRGHVASLLDQERPNIFTQSVANIMPGAKVEITIKYVEILPYEDGSFTFAFPMVVGPRFIPGKPVSKQGTGWAPDTTAVQDASKITPPVTPEGTRAGHDVDLTVSIDAGVPISTIESKLHKITIKRKGKTKAQVALASEKEIPNKDFVLKYQVAGDKIQSGILTHKDGENGYVTVIMIPPKKVTPQQIAPKEMIFVIDRSGSQSGKPLEKAKEAMRYFIDHMNPNDTFNIIDFGNTPRMLFSEPKKNTAEYRAKALAYMETLDGRGGTWMGPAVEAVVQNPPAENRLRIVTFMTDGYVGNDFEIINLVKKLRGKSRWFPFGTGNSVNRFLLDNMARVGGGEVEYILLNSSAEEVGRKFYQRIAEPVLTDISLSFDGIALQEVFPREVSDLWSRKPLVFRAKYTAPGKGKITLKGFSEGKPYEQTLDVTLPEKETANEVLGALWARAKVDSLMDEDLMGIQHGKPKEEIKEAIISVALAHRIMTQFTSFVAVEETTVTVDGKPTKVAVPVEMPEGVSREGVFGDVSGVAPRAAMMPIKSKLRAGVPSAPGALRYQRTPMVSRDIWRGRGVPAGRLEAAPQAPIEAEAAEEAPAPASGDKEVKERRILTKLAPKLASLVKLDKKTGDYTHENIVVKDGKVVVQVWISKSSDEIIKKLEKAGLKITFKASTGKTVIGSIEVEKLKELAEIPEVTLIEPVPVG